MRPILLPFTCVIIMCMLLTGCAIAPIQNTDDAVNAPSIIESLGDSPVAEGDDGKQLASEAMTGTVTTTVAASAPLSTPELIEVAYASGVLSAGERTLYLAYAVYDYAALPAAYQSSTPWRGTMLVADLKETVASPEFCAFTPEIQAELRRLMADAVEFSSCP